MPLLKVFLARMLAFGLVALAGYAIGWLQNRPWRFRPPRPKEIA